MYLKSLEMQGFKSFPDKTKLIFEDGTTVIVGPNGSGKSNISDAMRWVLGEISTKSIRGAKMEDIIFGGADSRKPMSFAEVSVTFDNTDKENRLESQFDEVTVTRRYYRAGESEYFINRRPVRLRDIYELFMNTGIGRDGYSIIGQGKIAEIISRKSDERRSIFEDASGIAKYRHKKRESENKLKATEDNMSRVRDILSELETQLGPLEKDAEKARRAIELLEAKKRVDVRLWLYDTEKLRSDIALAEERYKYSSFDLSNAEGALRSYEQQNEKLFLESQNNKRVSAELLEAIRRQTAENFENESAYKLNESAISHNRALTAEAEGAIMSARRAVEAEEVLARERREKISALQDQLKKHQAEHEQASNSSRALAARAHELSEATDSALADLRALEKEALDIRVRLSVIENARLEGGDRNTSITGELEEYEKLSVEYSQKCSEKQALIDQYSAQVEKAARLISQLEEQIGKAEAAMSAATSEAARLRLERNSCQQRIDTYRAMEEQLEGYSSSVRYVMKRYAEGKITNSLGIPCGRIYGPLSKLISVEDRYVSAVETALGANLQHIVVEDEGVAKSAMLALKRGGAGRATFFPLTSMRGQNATPELREAARYAGYVGVASELVRCESRFLDVVSNLLGRTVVFETIDDATAMAKALRYRVRAVTLDGQQINFGGSFTGGSTRTSGSILGRAGEIKRLEADLEDYNARIAAAETECARLSEELDEIKSRRAASEQNMKLTETLRTGEAAGLEQIRAKLDANNTLIEKLRADIKGLIERRQRQAEDMEELALREAEIGRQIDEISAFRSERDIERNALLEKKAELDDKAIKIYIRISETQKDIETETTLLNSSDERIRAHIAGIAEREERIAEYMAKTERLVAEQSENRARTQAGELELERLNAERARVESGGLEFEKRLGELNAKIRDKMAQKESIFRDHTQNENRLNQLRDEQDSLSNRLWDEHQLTRAEAVALNYPPLDAKKRAEAAAEQLSYRNRLRAIGNVDLDAVNKFTEVKARYDSKSEQLADLEKAKTELAGVICDLEKNMESTFVETFNRINNNFNRVFSELFGGGSAQLSLTDPSNVLESGIEISAAPPGKIIKNLMQLSGGEQAFVAIALFFAILQVNPTPFCILDEIEAALDEVNVGRFAEYIKKYSDDTQFVLITHRRGTMEAANRLYGVTMPEHGISKVLTLNIDEISKTKGDEWNGIF